MAALNNYIPAFLQLFKEEKHVKGFFCLLPVGLCIDAADAYVTIRSYVLCVSTHKLHACN